MNIIKSTLLESAVEIGENLLNKVIKKESGWTWETLSWSEEAGISWHTGDGIYSGTSGFVLFFIELYKQTNNEQYKEAAIKGMSWVEDYCKNNPTSYYAFFTGRMGVAYTMLQMNKLTNDEHYKEQALSVIENCEEFLNSPHPVDDLINGTSGCLLGLLHLHAATSDATLLPKIDRFAAHLVNSAEMGPHGLYWDRDSKSIRGLCGFSHGASGIGFVFLELAHYFQNPAYYWIAEQSFQYENHFYSEQHHNWPDFRKGIFTSKDYEDHKAAYLKNDIKFFTEPGHMAAWCHGAPGIGFSRLRVFELLQDSDYKRDLTNAIETTYNLHKLIGNAHMSYTLCHGGAGNAMLFIDAYKQFGNEEYLNMALEVANQAITSKEMNGFYKPGFGMVKEKVEDTSLFMGNAGIGYFYLQCHNPLKVPSILAPVVNETSKEQALQQYPFISMTKAELKKQVLKKEYKRTIETLEKSDNAAIDGFFQQTQSNKNNIKVDFRTFMYACNNEKARDIFDLENKKSLMSEAIVSNALLNIEQDVLRNTAKESITKIPAELTLKHDVKIATTRWNWDTIVQNNDDEPDEYSVLLIPTAEGIAEKSLSTFSHVVLKSFEKTANIDNALHAVLDTFEVETSEEKETIKEHVSKQVQEGLLSGVIVPAG